MLQRWLGTVLLYCEQKFKRVKGFVGIAQVTSTIEAEQAEQQPVQTKKAASENHGGHSENFNGLIDNFLDVRRAT